MLIIETYRSDHDSPTPLRKPRKALSDYPNDRGLQITQAILYGENKQPD